MHTESVGSQDFLEASTEHWVFLLTSRTGCAKRHAQQAHCGQKVPCRSSDADVRAAQEAEANALQPGNCEGGLHLLTASWLTLLQGVQPLMHECAHEEDCCSDCLHRPTQGLRQFRQSSVQAFSSSLLELSCGI